MTFTLVQMLQSWSSPVSSILNFDAWEADLANRLVGVGAYDYVFKQQIYNQVERSIQIHKASSRTEREVFSEVLKHLQIKDVGTDRHGNDDHVPEDTTPTMDLEANKEVIARAEYHISRDNRAWSCVQSGFTGWISYSIQGKTASQAFSLIKAAYCPLTRGTRRAVASELSGLRVTNLCPQAIHEFLERRFLLISALQKHCPEDTRYSWEKQYHELAYMVPQELMIIELADDEPEIDDQSYFDLCAAIREAATALVTVGR